jgi:NhaP-type Na+/H+ or K+/H+ antiporter
MNLNTTLQLGLILILGMLAQWIGWKVRLPSILFLLLAGIIAGPLTGLLTPASVFGEVLFPVVSLAVALILFEGGLSLRLKELPAFGPALRRLITLGALVTWAVATVAGLYFLDLPLGLALLLGAILIVTGPTVIQPLLASVRPLPRVASLLKWEGITIDPVGAVLAVLMLEVLNSGQISAAPGTIALGVLRTLLFGSLFGALGAGLLILLLRRYWIPDGLQNPVALTIVLTMFTLSNQLQHESGLLAVTLMGIIIANQSQVTIRQIVEFKENLRTLLLSGLFVVLAARLNLAELIGEVNLGGILFLC